MNKSNKKILIWSHFVSAALFIMALLFNNCSNNNQYRFSYNSKSYPQVSQAQGGGSGFDGKPSDGFWARTNPNFSCTNELNSVQSIIEIANGEPILINDNCETQSFSFSLSDPSLNFEFYNPNFFTFGGAIYEIIRPRPLAHFNESFCRFKDINQGIDIVVQNNNSAKLSAKVIKGEFSSQAISSVNYDVVSKEVSNTETLIQSEDGSLRLVIQGAPENYRDLNGTLTTHINGTLTDFPVTCQKMSEKPVLLVDVTGLMAYWKFDQPSLVEGSTVIDSKGYAPGNLTSGDTANKLVAGISGKALHLDGINDYVDMGPNVLNMGTNNFTVSLWIKNVTTPTARQVLGDRIDLGGSENGWNIMQFGDSFDPRMSDGTDDIKANNVPLPTNPNSFQHFVAVYDRTNNLIRTYVNGVLQRTVSTATVTGSVTFNGSFVIGTVGGINKDYFFLGDLDEVSVWNRALSDADVQALFQNVVLY